MSALLAFLLLAAPARAGVVMPVESGVAPAGPSVAGLPVVAPAAGGLTAPSFGGFGLSGGLPLLPSPVPGLLGPALGFMGASPEAAAILPAAVSVQASPAAGITRGAPVDKTPAVPAKPSAGGPSFAIARDRRSAAATPDGALTASQPGVEAASLPFADAGSVEKAGSEKLSGLGRGFFDGSDDDGRGALDDNASFAGPSPLIAATILDGGAFGPGASPSRLATPSPASAFGAGHGPAQDALSYAPEGETLRDAVGSGPVPGAAAAPAASAAAYFGSAAPNGELVFGPALVPGFAAIPSRSAPRPLALDLSGSGLIVRVRSALNGALGMSAPASSDPRLLSPGPSTALLERGGMLEAFSVAGAYADASAARPAPASEASAGSAGRRSASFPGGLNDVGSTTAPLWWAWLILPLFIAAFRGL